jgi:UDP-N-acetylmuramate--alanine ligase
MRSKEKYYFIGIGGIGMSALARYFKAAGAQVAGYDKTPSPLIDRLVEEGIEISFSQAEEQIPSYIIEADEELLVVRTPAVPADSAIIRYFEQKGVTIKKRSEVLAMVAASKRCLAVAGTHGKTTTSSILGHVLHQSSLSCTAFVGGVMSGYESNILLDPESDFVVLEADEFDRSFHRLRPEKAIITSMDPDHLDIYGDEQEFKRAFQAFAAQVESDIFHDIHVDLEGKELNVHSYGIEKGDVQAKNLRVRDGRFEFDLSLGSETWKGLSLDLPGRHNILNAIAALSMCHSLGVSEQEVRDGLASYQGVKRRFEYVLKDEGLVFIDDYAHHPSEIDASIHAARELYPGSKLTVAFQPHLFSRTRDFMTGFAESLSRADELILLPIYPAREEPIPGITSDALLDQIGLTNKVLCVKEELPTYIAGRELEVLLTLGAGDIDREIPRIKDILSERSRPKIS